MHRTPTPPTAWLKVGVLAAAVSLAAGGVRWWQSPAWLRPATLPEGGRIVEERFAAGTETARSFGQRTLFERSADTYFMHIVASESAFVHWMEALDIEEVSSPDGPGTREWMDPPTGRCVRGLVLFPAERYGVFAIACR